MKTDLISYFELLEIIKKEEAPKKISLILCNRSEVYCAEYDAGKFSHYVLEKDNENENFIYFLGECFLESDMFNKCIEVLDDDFEDIEECFAGVELEYNKDSLEYKINQLIRNQKKIIKRVKQQ